MLNRAQFQHNIELFARTNPQAAVLLPYTDFSHLTSCATQRNEPNLHGSGKGHPRYYHDPKGAKKEAQQWFQKINLERSDLLYVYGVGLGYAYEAARAWLKHKRKRRLVFLEDDLGVIAQLLATPLGSKIMRDHQVHLHFFTTVEGDPILQELPWKFLNTPYTMAALPSYAKARPEVFADLLHQMRYTGAQVEAVMHEYLHYGIAFFPNFYSNLYHMVGSRHGHALFRRFPKVPAIICGAGPSLQRNLSLLKTLTDRALIFAGGSSLNALSAHGIVPHFGGGIDPNIPQLDRLMNNLAYEVPFFYRHRMHHKACQTIHGDRLYMNGCGGYEIAEWFEEKLGISGEWIEEGHNIVNFLTSIACQMGCDPIIFVGMDLAFTGMKTYADGVIADPSITKKKMEQKYEAIDRPFLKKDIYGKPIHTMWMWMAESKWLSELAQQQTERTFINATEGGLGFKDVPNHSLQDVSEKYLSRQYDLANRVHAEIQRAQMPQVTQERIVEAMEEMKISLHKCIELIDTLIKETDVLRQRVIKGEVMPEEAMETGLMALCEDDISEEVGFKYILNGFNDMYLKLISGKMQQFKTHKMWSSAITKQVKKFDLYTDRNIFLRRVAEVNIACIDRVLKPEAHHV